MLSASLYDGCAMELSKKEMIAGHAHKQRHGYWPSDQWFKRRALSILQERLALQRRAHDRAIAALKIKKDREAAILKARDSRAKHDERRYTLTGVVGNSWTGRR